MKLTIALFFALSGLGCRDQVDRQQEFFRAYIWTHADCTLDSDNPPHEPYNPEGFSMYRCGKERTIINILYVDGKPWVRPQP